MFKISVQQDTKTNIEGFNDFEYYSAIVPMVGDSILIKSDFYKVSKRTIFSENQNFVIIHISER